MPLVSHATRGHHGSAMCGGRRLNINLLVQLVQYDHC